MQPGSILAPVTDTLTPLGDPVRLQPYRHNAASQPPVVAPRPGILQGLVWVGLLCGTLLVAWAYANAATELQGQTHYHLFWAGVLIFIIPATLRLFASDTPRGERLAVIIAIACFNYLPKFLRTPDAPLFHDELAHWRQAEMIYQTGHLFQPVPTVYMSQYFPGLESVTVFLRQLSGLSTWQIATLLILLAHAGTLVGVFVLAERFTRSARAAGIAALIFSLNANFMYFEAQYSYESLALMFVIWILVSVIQIQDAGHATGSVRAWFAIGVLLAGACVVTHHVSSYVTVLVLWLITVTSWFRVARGVEIVRTARYVTLLTVLMTAMASAWLAFMAPGMLDYLGAPLHNGLQQIEQIAQHKTSAHTLFAQSTTPGYEHEASFASVVLVFIGAVAGLFWLRRARQHSSVGVALALFGLLYFPSLPLIFTSSGSESARRSWTFSYIGLSMLIAPMLVAVLVWIARRPVLIRWLATAGLVAAIGIIQVGNVSTSVDELYRFPGAYVYGSDTRSTTDDLIAAAQWFLATHGVNNNVVTDRYVGEQFSGTGMQWTSQASGNLPIWELYFQRAIPGTFLLQQLQLQNYRFMVVDERAALFLPYLSVYFEHDEPGSLQRTKPLDKAAIDKYEHLPWTIKVYGSKELSIYRFDFSALHASWSPPVPRAAPIEGPKR
jgi:hypothetical protein